MLVTLRPHGRRRWAAEDRVGDDAALLARRRRSVLRDEANDAMAMILERSQLINPVVGGDAEFSRF